MSAWSSLAANAVRADDSHMVGMAGNNRLCEVSSTISAPGHVHVPDCAGIILAGCAGPIVDVIDRGAARSYPWKDSCYRGGKLTTIGLVQVWPWFVDLDRKTLWASDHPA